MTEPMTGEELAGRLSKGEDPLDLTIEKWERVVSAMEDGASWHELSAMNGFGRKTCGLCMTSDDDCGDCLYFQHFDNHCHSDGAFIDFVESEHIDDAKRVLEALHQIKEGR